MTCLIFGNINLLMNLFGNLEKYTLYVVLLLAPLAVLPLFPNPFGVTKVALLSFGVGIALLLKAINTIVKGKLTIGVGKFDIGVLFLLVSYILSAVLKTPNKIEAFFAPGTATVVISAALVYFLVNTYKKGEKENFFVVLFVSSLLISLVNLLAFSGLLARIPQLPAFAKDTLFTSLGGHLPAAIFLVSLLPFGIGLLVRESDYVKKVFWAVSVFVVLLGLGISVFTVLPGKETSPRLLDYATSWSVSVDTLKESPILGAGPDNYLTAFNRFRPISYNQTELWNTRFTSARSFYLTLLTEAGILGAAGVVFILLTLYRLIKEVKIAEVLSFKKAKYSSLVSLTALLTLFVFFSATVTNLALLFVILGLATASKKIDLNLSAKETGSPLAERLPAILVSLPVIAGLLAFGYYGQRALAAEATFKRSLDALAANDGTTTYEAMRQSISLNPYVDRYHASYTQVNLAIAQNLAQKEDLTDEDRQTIAQLIQQAIREAKATVTLNPQRSGNWQLLANTYRSIVAFAQGADTFAIQSYNQAIALDPINPNLRIALGGMYYALGNYDQAIRAFELAVVAKPDLANAHYNLAAALREKGDIEEAINEMTTVLSLVERDSQDYEIAKAELENLEQRQTSGELEEGESLQPPQGAEEPAIEPPLELPEDSNPPEGEEVPTPSPTPTPEE